jgi:hypothetical protein
VGAIVDEIDPQIRVSEQGKEHRLNAVAGGSYVLLERLRPPHHKKGFRGGIARVKTPGTPVEVSPQNMPVQNIFDRLPNLTALKQRVRKAWEQLTNDAAKDDSAQGFCVMQMSDGEAASNAIITRYLPSMPSNCLGVVILSSSTFLVPAAGLPTQVLDLMALAAKPTFPR